MGDFLRDLAITHGGIKPVFNQKLGVQVNGQTAVRYMRFLRPVEIERFEMKRTRYGRHIPNVPTHPAHLIFSVLDRTSGRWQTMREVELPCDPRIAGEGLSQEMRIEEMEAHFAPILEEIVHIDGLGGQKTDHLRVECDREHPVWPSHGEMNGGEFNVPFGTLNNLRAFGEVPGDMPRAEYNSILRAGKFEPAAPDGMRVVQRPNMLLFMGSYLSIGFSMRRPMLMHLGWDASGSGRASLNRVRVSRTGWNKFAMIGGASGPIFRGLDFDYGCHNWTGTVEVDGNRVSYTNLRCIDGMTVDASFTVEPRRIVLELTQNCARDLPALEAEAWRFAWELRAGMTGTVAEPILTQGRNGRVRMPLLWAGDGVGCLSCNLLQGSSGEARIHVESYREAEFGCSGFELGHAPEPGYCRVAPAGTRSAVFEMQVANLVPRDLKGELPAGAARQWATTFSCFRPEFGGFSNNAASSNCHLSQGNPIEVIGNTAKPVTGPDPLSLARFTIGRALMDGGGYGYWRNLYRDSDPVLVAAAGRIHGADPNGDWLSLIEPGLVQAVERMIETVDDGGLVVCTDLSGNSGSYRWSSNGMDVVGFGHLDAYVNAWSYRAFRNAAAMMDDLGKKDAAQRCRDAASGIRNSFADVFVNPESGWVAGWRSRDGNLHDCAFTYVNGPAIAFGLLDDDAARKAMAGLEALREKMGVGSAKLGLPVNILPIPPEDQMLSKILSGAQPIFEMYTDGALSSWAATYYLRALSMYGPEGAARKMAEELDEGFAEGIFNGGMSAGNEFLTWDGVPTGYEGVLIGCLSSVYSIAVEMGAIDPPDPEWWPVNG